MSGKFFELCSARHSDALRVLTLGVVLVTNVLSSQVATAAAPKAEEYAGSAACEGCHTYIYKRWLSTRHSYSVITGSQARAAGFPLPAQTILEVIYLCLLLGITVWVTNRNTDEVEVAAARFSASAGAFAGILCTVGFLIVMTRVPAVAEFIATLAESPGTDLPPCHHWLWSGCDGGDLSHVYLRDHRVCDMVLAVNALKNSISATSQL